MSEQGHWKMTVKELKLSNDLQCDFEIKFNDSNDTFEISICTLDGFQIMYLDRGQAELLRLYLERRV